MHLFFSKNKGWIELIAGSMFSGKSEELIRRLRRAKFANQNVKAFKHSVDKRYHEENIVSHSKNEIEAIPVSTVSDMREKINIDSIDVIGIDEAQFFEDDIVEFCEEMANLGKRVIIAGLDQDFRGEPFHPMPELMARAEYVDKLSAICMVCGDPASRTQRLVNDKPAYEDDPLIAVGARESYEARCRNCHEVKKREYKKNIRFIVGTDTEIGKTYVGLRLVKEDMEKGMKISALKPVETGLELFEDYKGSDSYAYAKLLNKKIEDINMYFFTKAESPHSAGAKDMVEMDIELIKDKILKEAENSDKVYVEGAGGLMVPYTEDYTYLDLLDELSKRAKVIVVAKNSLGTINHTLMTVETLKAKGIEIEKIVFNNIDNSEDREFLEENIRIVKKMTSIKNVEEIYFGD